jgi:hypothetical protein
MYYYYENEENSESNKVKFGVNSTEENTASRTIEKKYVGIGVNESKTNEISSQENQSVIYATVSAIVIIIIISISVIITIFVIRSLNKRKSQNIALLNLQNLNTELYNS